MENGNVIEKLNDDNFHIWKHRMKALLVTKGLDGALEKMDDPHSAQARAQMCLCVSADYVNLVASAESAFHAWQALETINAGQTAARRLKLRKDLTNLKKEPKESMITYIMRGKQLGTSLRAIDESVSDANLIDSILSGLPPEYENKVDMLVTLGETDMLKLQNQLLQAEASILAKEENTGQVAFSVNARRPKLVCSYCGRNGHTREKCWFLTGLPPHLQKGQRKTNDQHENIALCSYKGTQQTDYLLKYSWIIDSGATVHICSQQELFTNINDIEGAQKVVVGNGQAVTAEGTGTVKLARDIEMQNVLFCPELHVNLISVSKLFEKGCNVYFGNETCTIWKGKQKLFSATKLNGLYIVESQTEKACSAFDWHRKLAHFGQMTKLKTNVLGIPPEDIFDIDNCETCIRAKQTRQQIQKIKEENTSSVGELIHMDLMGPITPVGKNGEKYILSMLDEKSKIGVAKPLMRKSDTASTVINGLKYLERQTGNKIKCVRSDRGKEFLNEELRTFLNSSGIKQETSAPYTPQQNGNAERFNRTIIEKVRAVLLDSGLDKSFWNYAVDYCSYVRNRLPCQPHGRTPYEMVYNRKPSVEHLRIFGQRCFVLKNPTEASGKLDAKSKEGLFLGFEAGTKDAFKIFSEGKIIVSRNVIFPSELAPEMKRTENVQSSEDITWIGDGQEMQRESPTQTPDFHMDQPPVCDELDDSADTNDEHSNETAPERRYPLRARHTPQPFWIANVVLEEPKSIQEALSSQQSEDWKLALDEEIRSLSEQNVFEVVQTTPDIQPLPCKWVFKIKYDQHGNLQRFKARLVAKGYKQISGIDFHETFSPVAKQSTLRLLLTLAASRNLEIRNIDIKTAFLNGNLDEEIFMEMPPGYRLDGKVWKLKKTLYGLKQAPRAWHKRLTEELEKLGFSCSCADPGLFTGNEALLLVYVDDLLICGNGTDNVQRITDSLLKTFEGRDLGPTEFFIGIKVQRDREKKVVFLNQENYITNILARFRMSDCRSVSSPMEPGTKLSSEECADDTDFPFQELVGCLMYLAVSTRPDIAYATNYLARFVTCTRPCHVAAAKRILRYLQGTRNYGIVLGDWSETLLEGFCDASYGNCEETRRSTTGYVFTFKGSLISWQTKLQTTVAVSTTEAEYMAASAATKEALYLRKILNDVGFGAQCVTINCDNQGAVNLTKNALTVSRTKHVDIAHHFVRNRVNRGELSFKYIQTGQQLADFLTKALGPSKLLTILKKLGLVGWKAMSTGEC